MTDLTLRPVTAPDPAPLLEEMVRRRFLGEYRDPAAARAAAKAWAGRVLPRARHLRVVDDGSSAESAEVDRGGCWLVEQGDDLAVLALDLRDPADAPAVRLLVEEVAAREGVRRLTVGLSPGDPTTAAFVADAGFELSARQMRLELTDDLPGEEALVLVPMDAAEWDAWVADEVEGYVAERVAAGETPERARQVAREQHDELLPDGLATRDQHFFVGRVAGERVGVLWLSTERPLAFVYDVTVDEARRRQGHGAALMRAGALWARAAGAPALGLNVFGPNHAARALYDRLGYRVVEDLLGKAL